MKTPFGKYAISISILMLTIFPQGTLRSCGPSMEPDQAMYMLFSREMAGDPSLEAFYYTGRFLNGGSDPEAKDNWRNCREWAAYSDGAATVKDIYNIQYNLSAHAFLYARKTGEWGTLADNSFIRWLQAHKDAMDYFAVAKAAEADGGDEWDSWDSNSGMYETSTPHMPVSDVLAIDDFLKKCDGQIDEFLKQRYAFQALKQQYYRRYESRRDAFGDVPSPTDDTVLSRCYEKYLMGKNTIVTDWGMFYYAFSFADRAKTSACLIRAFDRCESKKVVVYNNVSIADADSLLKTETSPSMRAVLHAFKAMRMPGRALTEIKNVCENDPDSKYIRLLITREINKVENWVLAPEVLGYDPVLRDNEGQNSDDETGYSRYAAKNLMKDKAYEQALCEYIAQLRSKSGVNNDFITLALVRLHHIEKNFAAAATLLHKLPRQQDRAMEIQRNIEEIVSKMYTQDIKSKEVQASLYTNIHVLEQMNTLNNTMTFWDCPYNFPLNELYLVLSKQFLLKGDVVLAGMLFTNAKMPVNEYVFPGPDSNYAGDMTNYYRQISYLDKYGKPEDVDAFFRFIHKENKTPFEQCIAPGYKVDSEAFTELKGTLLLRQGKFEEALAVMSSLADNYWEVNYDFRYYLRLSSVTSVGLLLPVTTGERSEYSLRGKKEILRDIVRLRKALKKAATQEEKASICFMLGNAYFNITYYGKDWMVYSYGRSCVETSEYDSYYKWASFSFWPNIGHVRKAYYECSWAMDMYRQSLAYNHGNKELAAQCLLLLNLCDQYAHDFVATQKAKSGDVPNRGGKQPEFVSPYLKWLKKRYSKAEVYDLASTSCPDVAAYLTAN